MLAKNIILFYNELTQSVRVWFISLIGAQTIRKMVELQ